LDLGNILAELKQERERINRAIAALEGLTVSNASPNKKAVAKSVASKQVRRGGLTPAGRKRLSEAMKRRWVERRRKVS
jgi:hypothetical protein